MPTAHISSLRAGLSAGAFSWRLLKPLNGFGSAPNAFGSALACAAPPTRKPTAIAALASIFVIDIAGISCLVDVLMGARFAGAHQQLLRSAATSVRRPASAVWIQMSPNRRRLRHRNRDARQRWAGVSYFHFESVHHRLVSDHVSV